MEENICRCGRTPSEVGEEFVSEDEGRMELSYASVREDEYVAPPVENSIPLPIPAPAPCCQGSHTTLPALEEITEEPAFICEDLDGLLREADEERAREKGAEGHLFSSLYQKGYLKMSWRVSEFRRARRVFRVFALFRSWSNQHSSTQGR